MLNVELEAGASGYLPAQNFPHSIHICWWWSCSVWNIPCRLEQQTIIISRNDSLYFTKDRRTINQGSTLECTWTGRIGMHRARTSRVRYSRVRSFPGSVIHGVRSFPVSKCSTKLLMHFGPRYTSIGAGNDRTRTSGEWPNPGKFGFGRSQLQLMSNVDQSVSIA